MTTWRVANFCNSIKKIKLKKSTLLCEGKNSALLCAVTEEKGFCPFLRFVDCTVVHIDVFCPDLILAADSTLDNENQSLIHASISTPDHTHTTWTSDYTHILHEHLTTHTLREHLTTHTHTTWTSDYTHTTWTSSHTHYMNIWHTTWTSHANYRTSDTHRQLFKLPNRFKTNWKEQNTRQIGV